MSDLLVPSGEWTKVRFDEVDQDPLWFADLEGGAFMANAAMRCDFDASVFLVMADLAVGMVRCELMLNRNGEGIYLGKSGGGYTDESGLPHPWARAPLAIRASGNFPEMRVEAGEVFELLVRHDAGWQVPLRVAKGEPDAANFLVAYEALGEAS